MELWVLLGAGLLTAGDPPTADALKKELARLEGTWDAIPPEGTKVTPLQLAFTSGKLTVIWPGDGSLPAAIKVDPSTNPKCIDIEFKKLRQEAYEGIYQIDGDTLKLFLGPANIKERPTRFPERVDPVNEPRFMIFKRQKN